MLKSKSSTRLIKSRVQLEVKESKSKEQPPCHKRNRHVLLNDGLHQFQTIQINKARRENVSTLKILRKHKN